VNATSGPPASGSISLSVKGHTVTLEEQGWGLKAACAYCDGAGAYYCTTSGPNDEYPRGAGHLCMQCAFAALYQRAGIPLPK
jgi:hypothetical protein